MPSVAEFAGRLRDASSKSLEAHDADWSAGRSLTIGDRSFAARAVVVIAAELDLSDVGAAALDSMWDGRTIGWCGQCGGLGLLRC